MNAITFHGVGDVRTRDVADPKIVDPADIVLRITTSAVCGSDLNQYHGRGGALVQTEFFKDLSLKMGICNARTYMGPLLPLVRAGKLRPARIITHTMALEDAPKGYAIFDRKEDRAIKVMLRP
jgi:threonine dehydrogenase-like Zn-dependent dehydrogenase